MQMQYLIFKMIFPTALIIIFNYIKFANCKSFFFGGTGLNTLFIGNKLYYLSYPDLTFFYVDLTGVSLDDDTLVDRSKWKDLTDIKPRPDGLLPKNPILGGKTNDQIMFVSIDDELTITSFDTATKQWIMSQNVKSLTSGYFTSGTNGWVGKTGKAYTFDSIYKGMAIFDTINLSVGFSVSNPENLSEKSVYYNDFVQVMVPNGQILIVGGRLNNNEPNSMKSLLTYDSVKDTWQITNTVGTAPQGRTKHTAVSTSDGRVILFGGTLHDVPALPQLAVLDTSKTPYEWITPAEENPIGNFSEHTAVMVNNYMIFAFGKNESETKLSKSNNKDIYKLNISDPLNYKWSLLASYDGTPTSTTPSNGTPIQTDVSISNIPFLNNFELKTHWIITIVIVIIALICLSILAIYKIRQYRQSRNKNRVKDTNQHKLPSNDDLDIESSAAM